MKADAPVGDASPGKPCLAAEGGAMVNMPSVKTSLMGTTACEILVNIALLTYNEVWDDTTEPIVKLTYRIRYVLTIMVAALVFFAVWKESHWLLLLAGPWFLIHFSYYTSTLEMEEGSEPNIWKVAGAFLMFCLRLVTLFLVVLYRQEMGDKLY